ncbi:hypothetical protein ACL02R_27520 [Streptomyces sp. MS19]|uniref:hypothetical protein n=1 Tax=Streptomyces sp. MS19 TaxID=3385972 RepID=UPI0039A1F0AC
MTAHILHGCVRRLSHGRDGHAGGLTSTPGEGLPAFLTRANGDFAATARQFSPRLLRDLVGRIGP